MHVFVPSAQTVRSINEVKYDLQLWRGIRRVGDIYVESPSLDQKLACCPNINCFKNDLESLSSHRDLPTTAGS